jgi:uncharacterized integral membrane protein (TIGR00697 family)
MVQSIHTTNAKKQLLFVALASVFVANALLAEIIGAKLFSLEKTLGVQELNLSLFAQGPFGLTFTAGVLVWPVVFLTTDIINEYFGKRGVRLISVITAILICYAFAISWLVTLLEPSDFWLSNYTAFNISEAFNAIFRQGMGIMVGSIVAFLVGQFTDVFVFQKLRSLTGSKLLWLRATGSTLVSQLIDSFVVLLIAFYIFNDYPLTFVLAVGLINYCYKFFIAVLLTPVIYLTHKVIDKYLGDEYAKQMMEEAATTTF